MSRPILQQIDGFHKTFVGYTVFGLAELAITYGFISLAIDRGNLLYYLLALIFLVGTLGNLFSFVRSLSQIGKRRG